MGAWTRFYALTKPRMSATEGTPMAYGIVAIKRELVYNGFGDSRLDRDSPIFGGAAHNAAKEFQHHVMGATASGVVGPSTAKWLFRKRTADVERKFAIPDKLLCKLKTLESANDPGATGWMDSADRGLCQINARANPQVTDEQAFSPAFALGWTAEKLRTAEASFGDWDAALAAHNIGWVYARQWLKAGKPAKGGPVIGGQDWWARATTYVRVVRAAAC